jgi:flavin reductase (DIM6/NTAB) family NADH-FMN oxidoreductase RutF
MDGPSVIDRKQFRQTLGCFPTGVTVVTGMGPDGELLGVTVNSFSSVSLEPPLILFCLDKGLRSLPAFKAASHYTVNVLCQDQGNIATRFASRDDDKWRGMVPLHGENGCPVIGNAMAVLECAAYTQFEAGDHVIFVGEVVAIRARPDARPLIFHSGRYEALAMSPEGVS